VSLAIETATMPSCELNNYHAPFINDF